MPFVSLEYTSPIYEKMGFELIRDYLVTMGYPQEIRDFDYDPSFPIRYFLWLVINRITTDLVSYSIIIILISTMYYSTLAKFMKKNFTSYWNGVKNGKLKSVYLLNGWSYNFFVNG